MKDIAHKGVGADDSFCVPRKDRRSALQKVGGQVGMCEQLVLC